ncbi:hypothetical protein J437_LFUL000775, partial [Ladona fulva]
KANYVVANLIAKKIKHFTGGEFIKECLESVADIIYPEKISDFCEISLSHQTIASHIKDTAKFIKKCATFKFYSIALYENTHSTDAAQLANFTGGIDNEFNINEELTSLIPLKDTTRSVDLYEAVKARFFLTINSMSSIVTDGAPVVVGKKERLTKVRQCRK